jgi:hypothetical protein
MHAADWDHPDRHTTAELSRSAAGVTLLRTLDRDTYRVLIAFTGAACARTGPHRFVLTPAADAFEFSVAFRPTAGAPSARPVTFPQYWTRGEMLALESADPRARELERRIVLSQYLTAIQCAGSMPPQETGLTCNSWYGKYHLEMHYWHAGRWAGTAVSSPRRARRRSSRATQAHAGPR